MLHTYVINPHSLDFQSHLQAYNPMQDKLLEECQVLHGQNFLSPVHSVGALANWFPPFRPAGLVSSWPFVSSPLVYSSLHLLSNIRLQII